GEEADQVERREQPADDLVERGEALAEGGRLVGREFGELRFELQVGAARAVLERDERLRRQRLEIGRALVLPLAERPARPDVLEEPLELFDLAPQRRIARLRLLAHALEPALDVVA